MGFAPTIWRQHGDFALNYLAHLHLADHTKTSLLGTILGDFVKGAPSGAEINSFQEPLKTGILLHRQIDGFTDRLPINLQLRTLFPQHLQRYHNICLDIFWDYLLSQDWRTYHQASKTAFIQQVYRKLRGELADLESRQSSGPVHRANALIQTMIRVDWLSSYEQLPTVRMALERVGQRLRKPVPLHETVQVLVSHHELLRNHFTDFYPQLMRFSNESALRITNEAANSQ